MAYNLVWSYSMLDMFETCPKKWYHKYILKEKEPESPEMAKGNFVHKSIESYLLGKGDLPSELSVNKAMIDSIKGQFSEQSQAELKMGLTESLKPTGFFGTEVWGRLAADVALIHYDRDYAFLGDWKTGKKKDKEDQIKIGALFLFRHYCKLQKISGCNLWLKENKMGEVYTFKREDEPKLWGELLPRLKVMYDALGTPAATQEKPGFLCKSYCPVTSCKFNGSYKYDAGR